MATRRQAQEKVLTKIVAGLFGLVVIVVIAIGIYMGLGVLGEPKVHASTGCQVEGKRSLTVILMDTSDVFTGAQKLRLQNSLERVRRSIKPHSRLVLYAVDAGSETGLSDSIADVCNPGDPADASEWTSNPRLLEKRYEEVFSSPFFKALESIVGFTEADASPVVQAIEAASINTFGKIGDAEDVYKRMIIVSDMMQNTPEYSFYDSIPSIGEFEKSSLYRMHKPSIDDVEVNIWMVNRENAANRISARALAEFWIGYLGQFGADVTEIDRTRI